MKKEALAVLLTDLHIEEDTIDVCVDIVMQAVSLAVSLNVKYIINMGDSFNSRKSQTLRVLKAFESALDICHSEGIVMITIDGNHDKLMYNSEDSYLDAYKTHPAMVLVKTYAYNILGNKNHNGVKISALSFFSDNNQSTSNAIYNKYLKSLSLKTEIHPESIHILVTHHGLDGARSNSGVPIQSDILVSNFSKFNQVKVGHYHDESWIGNKIHYIRACRQAWFTEKQSKGFTVIHSDGSEGFHQSDFKKYTEIDVRLEDEYPKYVSEAVKTLLKKHDDDYKRINLIGDRSSVKSIDIHAIKAKGIDVRTTDITDIVGQEEQAEEFKFVSFDKNAVLDLFTEFVEEESIEEEQLEYGMEVLGRVINNN